MDRFIEFNKKIAACYDTTLKSNMDRFIVDEETLNAFTAVL